MHDTRLKRLAVIAAVVGVAVVVWGLIAYSPTVAIAGAAVSVVFLSLAARRRWLVLLFTTITGVLMIWGAFGTVTGYFLLNRHRLDAVVVAIATLPPTLRSIEIGQEDELYPGTASPARFDSYRFINGTAVTLYRRQVAPAAWQPILYADDVLHGVHVTRDQYDRLRALLERLSLSGFGRGPGDEIRLTRHVGGRAPWVAEFVHRADGRSPEPECQLEQRRLDPHWVWQLCG